MRDIRGEAVLNSDSASQVFPDMISTADSALGKSFSTYQQGADWVYPFVIMLEPDNSRLP